jgi:hypothetical protein
MAAAKMKTATMFMLRSSSARRTTESGIARRGTGSFRRMLAW